MQDFQLLNEKPSQFDEKTSFPVRFLHYVFHRNIGNKL